MDIQIIRKKDGRIDRSNGLVINSRLRVTAYCRVSTGDEEQINSYESQKKYYKEKITSNAKWTFAGIYADEAISGTLDYKRTDFMRMIQDALDNKFDMIITKSISRFARNTVDTLKYVRLLKEHNISVQFEEERINTLEMSGELLLTILSSVAQQESENISTHVKLGLKMKKERGELVGFNNCLGYRYDSKSKKMEIVPEEAELIRTIFNWYCEGYGVSMIAKKLSMMKIKTFKGNDKWADSSIRRILKNEKYKGDVLQGKSFTLDPISHKRVTNMGEEDKYYITNHHESIISPEIFDKVQEILKERCGARATGRRLGNIGRKFTFSNRLRCAFCGDVLTRRSLYSNRKAVDPAWQCIQSVKFGKQYCPESKALKEKVIENAFVDAYQILSLNNKSAVDKFLKNIEKTLNDNSNNEKIYLLEKKKEELKVKKEKLIDYMIEGTLSKNEYQSKKESFENKIEGIEKNIEQLQLIVEDEKNIEKGLEKFKNVFEQNDMLNEFDKDVFDALVDYVVVGGFDKNGQRDNYMLRFICKNQFKESGKDKITKEYITNKYGKNGCDNNLVILDFINRQNCMSFDRDENGRYNKKVINQIRVRIEMSLD